MENKKAIQEVKYEAKRDSFSFDEREPEIGAYISLVWEDGSDCECTYSGLDKLILPLPTHWYYVPTLVDGGVCGNINSAGISRLRLVAGRIIKK